MEPCTWATFISSPSLLDKEVGTSAEEGREVSDEEEEVVDLESFTVRKSGKQAKRMKQTMDYQGKLGSGASGKG